MAEQPVSGLSNFSENRNKKINYPKKNNDKLLNHLENLIKYLALNNTITTFLIHKETKNKKFVLSYIT